MANSMIVSRQWATRPSDERYLSVQELHAAVVARRSSSAVVDVALDQIQVSPETGEDPDSDLALVDTTGRNFGRLTHWAFGQLSSRAHAPAGYLRTLPTIMAAMNLQWGLEMAERGERESLDARILSRQNGALHAASFNTTSYGRIWDAEVTGAVLENVDLDVWRVPSASYSASDPKRATTLYASDRDVFMFLVNEQAGIDANGENIKRGVYLWNSEVGSATFGIATFLYDYVCDNRIIWGQKEFRELKIRHTAGGPHRFMAQAVPQLQAYAQSSAAAAEQTIRRAKAHEIAADKVGVLDWMKRRGFTVPQARAAYQKAEEDIRGYNPRSLWGIVQGVTDAAHGVTHSDDRTALERKAGSLLDIVAE